MLARLETDTSVVMTSMVGVCVRMFLEKRDTALARFTQAFTQLTASDDKVNQVEKFLNQLYAELERDPMWISKYNFITILFFLT